MQATEYPPLSTSLKFSNKPKLAKPSSTLPPWQVLIVDDDDAVHQVTKLVMRGFEFCGRNIEFLSAFDGEEAKQILIDQPNIAMTLLDVVMESNDAGLQLTRWIREDLGNLNIRIVLRTGQPGQAPEEKVIRDFDINDYKEKTELTHAKLVTVFYASLRGYRDIIKLERAKLSLRRAISAISSVYDVQNLREFASAVLEQLNDLLNFNGDGLCASITESYAASSNEGQLKILAATDAYADLQLDNSIDNLPPSAKSSIHKALQDKQHHFDDYSVTCYYRSRVGSETVVYLSFDNKIEAEGQELLEIFTANVAITYESLLLREEIEDTQRSTIYILGEAVEKRSKETGAHVKRVGEISALLGRGLALPERYIGDLLQAAPLHDIGKIGIPDAILNKPGKFEPDEWEIMKQHAFIGYELLANSDKRILQMAATIAHQHHEKWDGTGYPQGLAGEHIDIAGRISALADVVDALVSKRCYKSSWRLSDALDYVKSESGKHFDPALINILFSNLDQLEAIYERYPDNPCIA